jgi:hypothetical protein
MTYTIANFNADNIVSNAVVAAQSACKDIEHVLSDIQDNALTGAGGITDTSVANYLQATLLPADGTHAEPEGPYGRYVLVNGVGHHLTGADITAGTYLGAKLYTNTNGTKGNTGPDLTLAELTPIYRMDADLVGSTLPNPTNNSLDNANGQVTYADPANVPLKYGATLTSDMNITDASGAMVIDDLMQKISTKVQVASQLLSSANNIAKTASRILSQG